MLYNCNLGTAVDLDRDSLHSISVQLVILAWFILLAIFWHSIGVAIFCIILPNFARRLLRPCCVHIRWHILVWRKTNHGGDNTLFASENPLLVVIFPLHGCLRRREKGGMYSRKSCRSVCPPKISPNHAFIHTRGLHNDSCILLQFHYVSWGDCGSNGRAANPNRSMAPNSSIVVAGMLDIWLWPILPARTQKISKHSQCKGQGTMQDAHSICTPWKYSPPRPPRLIKMQEAPRNQGVPAPHLPIRLGPPNGDDDSGGFLHRPGGCHSSSIMYDTKASIGECITTFWQSLWSKFV